MSPFSNLSFKSHHSPLSIYPLFSVLPAHSILRLLQGEVSVELQVYAASGRWQQSPRQQQVAGVSVGIARTVDDSARRRYHNGFLFAVQVCGEAIAVC